MKVVILELTKLISWGVSVNLNLRWLYQQKANWRTALRWRAASLHYEAKQKHGDRLQPKMYLLCRGQ